MIPACLPKSCLRNQLRQISLGAGRRRRGSHKDYHLNLGKKKQGLNFMRSLPPAGMTRNRAAFRIDLPITFTRISPDTMLSPSLPILPIAGNLTYKESKMITTELFKIRGPILEMRSGSGKLVNKFKIAELKANLFV